MRTLGVDPGEKRIGIAVSDPTGTIANPLTVLQHVSRQENAAAISRLAAEHGVGRIVVGQSRDENGKPTFEGRRAARLATTIRVQTKIQVELWDESFSTEDAQKAAVALRIPRQKRKKRSHMDELAATVILQSYLDANRPNNRNHNPEKLP